MSTHLVDAYGDLAPVEAFVDEFTGELVDAYGDTVPSELWEVDCIPDESGVCVCGQVVSS